MPARIKVLRGVYAQAAHIQSAQVFLTYFDLLKTLPREILVEHEKVDSSRLRRRLAQFKSTILYRTSDAFDLTLITLANRHPLMILRDQRVIQHLARLFLKEFATTTSVPPMISNQQVYRARRDEIYHRIQAERAKLLSSDILRATVNSKRVATLWRRDLVEASNNPHDLNMAINIAADLGIELLPKNKKARNLRSGPSTNSVLKN